MVPLRYLVQHRLLNASEPVNPLLGNTESASRPTLDYFDSSQYSWLTVKAWPYTLIRLGLFAVFAIACEKQGSSPNTQQTAPERALQPVEAIDVGRPRLGKSAVDEPGTVVKYEQTLFRQPPYYSGEMPLKYISTRRPIGGYSEYYVVSDEFDSWRNDYVYEDSSHRYIGIADGARAIDKEGKVLAEAKLLKVMPSEGFQVEEFHYMNGKVRFYCKSRFTLSGTKQSEDDKRGTKERDFFFLWSSN